MGNHKLKKKKNFFESLYKSGKNNYKIWWHWNPKAKFHQHKGPILIKKNIDINKIVVFNKVFFGKKTI